MISHRIAKPVHTMCEHAHCPRCGQPIFVAEIEDPEAKMFTPVEQQIVCPQCYGFISALMSLKRVVTYPAPVGDFFDEDEPSAEDSPSIRLF